MAVGISSEGIIWVPGESSGTNQVGQLVALPEDIIPSGVFVVLTEDFASESYVNTAISDSASDATLAISILRDELVASGYLA